MVERADVDLGWHCKESYIAYFVLLSGQAVGATHVDLTKEGSIAVGFPEMEVDIANSIALPQEACASMEVAVAEKVDEDKVQV